MLMRFVRRFFSHPAVGLLLSVIGFFSLLAFVLYLGELASKKHWQELGRERALERRHQMRREAYRACIAHHLPSECGARPSPDLWAECVVHHSPADCGKAPY